MFPYKKIIYKKIKYNKIKCKKNKWNIKYILTGSILLVVQKSCHFAAGQLILKGHVDCVIFENLI